MKCWRIPPGVELCFKVKFCLYIIDVHNFFSPYSIYIEFCIVWSRCILTKMHSFYYRYLQNVNVLKQMWSISKILNTSTIIEWFKLQWFSKLNTCLLYLKSHVMFIFVQIFKFYWFFMFAVSNVSHHIMSSFFKFSNSTDFFYKS